MKVKIYIPVLKRNAFVQTASYRPLLDGVRWELKSKTVYNDPWGQVITVPKGFTTDFASIPDLSRIALEILTVCLALSSLSLWFLLIVAPAWWVVYISESFLHEGTWDDQSVLHDYIYATRCRTFWQANWILLVSMKAPGAAQTPAWKRYIIFLGVTLGGYVAWIQDARKIQNRQTEKFIAPAEAKNKS